MMPGQNGFDLTKQIRMNKYTCTVPIIVISARNTEEDKVKGISNGADAYLTKPFSSMILKSMVDRLVMNKQILKNYYNSPESAYQYLNGHLTHQDDKDFLESVIQIIKTNIEKDSLGPEFVASEMGMNVRKFYRKFKEVSQLAPSDFIKDYRFSYAAKLLLSTNMSVQEVIYKVGIINKSYFYREFSKKYNMTPKEYRLQKNETIAK
jgi:AraC-like DNA-binding protein